MKGLPRELRAWVVDRDGRSKASLLIHIVAVLIERCLEYVTECGEGAGMPMRVSTRGVGAAGGMLE